VGAFGVGDELAGDLAEHGAGVEPGAVLDGLVFFAEEEPVFDRGGFFGAGGVLPGDGDGDGLASEGGGVLEVIGGDLPCGASLGFMGGPPFAPRRSMAT